MGKIQKQMDITLIARSDISHFGDEQVSYTEKEAKQGYSDHKPEKPMNIGQFIILLIFGLMLVGHLIGKND